MLRRTSSRNLYLQKSCEIFPQDKLDRTMEEVFFDRIRSGEKILQQVAVKDFNSFEELFQVGKADVELTNLIRNLSSIDSSQVTNSLKLLIEKLKNPIRVLKALEEELLEVLTDMLTDLNSFVNPDIIDYTLELILVLSGNFEASLKMIKNKNLMDVLMYFFFDEKLMVASAQVLFTLSSNILVVDKLLTQDRFVKQIKTLTCNSKPVEEVFACVANFISRKPETFARTEIYKALHQHLLASNEAENIMKCMAFLLSCDKGLELAERNDFAKVLIKILMNTASEIVQTYAIVALKNCMLRKNAFKNVLYPWTDLVELLIRTSYTKKNILLQETSLQALRFISDKPSVKDSLRKIYKKKIRRIACLSEKAEELKNDLLPWINYRNYKAPKDEKYSKLFI